MLLTDLLLTSLVGGDVDCGVAGWGGVLPRYTVNSLHLKAVAGVSLQVPHHHLPLPQPQPARSDVHVVITARAGATVSQAFLTHHIIDQVTPPACVLGLLPLQGQRGLVHAGYNAARRRGNSCKKHTRRCLRRWAGRIEKHTTEALVMFPMQCLHYPLWMVKKYFTISVRRQQEVVCTDTGKECNPILFFIKSCK